MLKKIIGADIPLSGFEELIQKCIDLSKNENHVLYMAGQRGMGRVFPVTAYCENNLAANVAFYPYYEVCDDFPILKKDCDIWIDRNTDIHLIDRPGVTGEKLVLFATMFPLYNHEGNSFGMRFWIDVLKQRGYKIHLLYYNIYNFPVTESDQKRASEGFDKVIVINPVGIYQASSMNSHPDDWCSCEVIDTVKNLVNQYTYDICFTNYAFFTSIFEFCHAYTQKILFTHDVFRDRNQTMLRQGYSEYCWVSLTPQGEKLACERADAIIAVTDEEAKRFREITDKPVYSVIPLPCAKELLLPIYKKGDVIYIGYFGSSNWVNDTNLMAFATELAKRKDLLAKVHMVLAGPVSLKIDNYWPADLLNQVQYTVLGPVDDLDDLMRQCTLVINPDRGGSGVKIKTLDTLCRGVALLSTPGGCSGIETNSHFHQAQDFSGLCDLVEEIVARPQCIEELRALSVTLYRDLVAKQGKNIDLMLKPEPRGQLLKTSEGQQVLTWTCKMFYKLFSRDDVQGKTVLLMQSDDHGLAGVLQANGVQKVYVATANLPGGVALSSGGNTCVQVDEDWLGVPQQSLDCVYIDQDVILDEAFYDRLATHLKPSGLFYCFGESLTKNCETSTRSLTPGFLSQYAYIEPIAHDVNKVVIHGRLKSVSLYQEKYVPGLVSIIIPCYNVKPYIWECVQSVIRQDYEHLEIILVDDCSSDGTSEVLNHLAILDSRIVIHRHHHNLGLGPARNTGAAQAHGEYLFFLDSDDYLASSWVIKTLVGQIRENNVPVAVSICNVLTPKGELIAGDRASYRSTVAAKIYDGQDVALGSLRIAPYTNFPVRAWGTLINARFYDTLNLLPFPPGAHEDIAFIPFMYAQAKQVYYSNCEGVIYRQRETSLSNKAWRSCDCVVHLQNWEVTKKNLASSGLEDFLPEFAYAILKAHLWKVFENGINQLALADLVSTFTYIAQDIKQHEIDQNDFNYIYSFFRGMQKMVPESCLVNILGNFNLQNITNYYRDLKQLDRELPKLPVLQTVDHGETIPGISKENQEIENKSITLPQDEQALYYALGKNWAGSGKVVIVNSCVNQASRLLIKGLANTAPSNFPGIDVLEINAVIAKTEVSKSLKSYWEELVPQKKTALQILNNFALDDNLPYQHAIEYLVLNACDDARMIDQTIRACFPQLICDTSLVVCQNYMDARNFYIQIAMERLAPYFSPLFELTDSQTYVWRCIKPITQGILVDAFGVPTDETSQCSWIMQYSINDILLQKKQTQMTTKHGRFVLGLMRAVYNQSMGKFQEAKVIMHNLYRQYPDVSAMHFDQTATQQFNFSEK